MASMISRSISILLLHQHRVIAVDSVGTLSGVVGGFAIRPPAVLPVSCRHATMLQASRPTLDFQSDSEKFGRGDYHLSASLEEGDVVVYQGGTWLVDGVAVGSGSTPTYHYAMVETIQLVWTHNCEHGVIRGVSLDAIEVSEENPVGFRVKQPLEEVEFGPEQLLARVPIVADGEQESSIMTAAVTFDRLMWEEDTRKLMGDDIF